MKTLNANEAKTHFGDMLLSAQQNPIQINKNGKPVAVVLSMSDYQHMEALKLQMLKERFVKAKKDIAEGNFSDGEAFFDDIMSEFE